MKSVVCVDPDRTSLERVGDPNGGVEVRGVNGCGCVSLCKYLIQDMRCTSRETVCGRVSDLDGILLCLELGNGADWAKDLLLHDLHVLGDVGEDGWLDEVSDITLALATSLNLGAGFLTSVDVAHDAVKLKLADLRTLEGFIVERIA